MCNFLKKSIAFISVIAMILSAVPFAVQAEEQKETFSSNSSGENVVFQELSSNEKCPAITEVIALREKNVKHFALDDGTYKAVTYSHAVHRKDENGEWKDINNNLKLSTAKSSSLYVTKDERTSFSATLPSFSLQERGYVVSMSLKTSLTLSTASSAKISNLHERSSVNSFTSMEEARTVSNQSSVVYENVKPNTDIEYLLLGNDIKENIIINAPSNSYSYRFDLVLNGLTAEIDEDGSVLLSDIETQEAVYVIPAPYMYDADGTYSYNVHYVLENITSGTYTLTVNADAAWINDPCRAFPVTVDPTVSDVGECYDTYISASAPTQNNAESEALRVSANEIAYIYCPNPSLPEGSTIRWVYLYVTYYAANTEGTVTLNAHQILSDWDDSTLTWQNASVHSNMGLKTAPEDSVSLEIDESLTQDSSDYFAFDITELGSAWYNNNVANYGIAVKHGGGTCSAVNLAAAEDPYCVSFLEISYIHNIPDGVYYFSVASEANTYLQVAKNVDDPCTIDFYTICALSTTSNIKSNLNSSLAFKISQVGNSSRYVIRSMQDNCITLGVSNGSIVLKETTPADEDVPLADTFTFLWWNDGFRIIHYTTGYFIGYDSSSKEFTPRASETESGDTFLLTKYTGGSKAVFSDLELNYNTIQPGMSTTFAIGRAACTEINYNTFEISYIPEGDGEVNLTWDAVSRTATVEWYRGKVKFVLQMKNTSGDIAFSTTSSSAYGIEDTLEGTYYIRNREYNKHLQAESLKYYTAGASIQLHNFAGNQQEWEFIYVSQGYYRIKSVKSGLYLSVSPEATSSSGASIIQLSYQETDNQLWRISVSPSESELETAINAFVIRPKLGISQNWCVKGYIGGTASYVSQLPYVLDDEHSDEWFLEIASTVVQLEDQEMERWCWVACARMMSSFYMKSHVSQEETVIHVKNLDPTDDLNVRGTLQDTAQAIEFILGSYNNTYYENNATYSEADLRTILDEAPITVLLRNENASRGHFVVIYGYEFDASKNCYIYNIYDPTPESTNLIKMTQASYQEFFTGIQASDGTYFWQGIVVFKTYLYANTIPIT